MSVLQGSRYCQILVTLSASGWQSMYMWVRVTEIVYVGSRVRERERGQEHVTHPLNMIKQSSFLISAHSRNIGESMGVDTQGAMHGTRAQHQGTAPGHQGTDPATIKVHTARPQCHQGTMHIYTMSARSVHLGLFISVWTSSYQLCQQFPAPHFVSIVHAQPTKSSQKEQSSGSPCKCTNYLVFLSSFLFSLHVSDHTVWVWVHVIERGAEYWMNLQQWRKIWLIE